MQLREKAVTLGPGHTLGISAYNLGRSLPTIVLLNGSAFNYRQWDKIISCGFKSQLRKDYALVRYDYGRTGRSTSPGTSWSLRDLATELLQLLDQLKVERAHLYGISKGTIVAQAFSLSHPTRVASVAGYGWYFHRFSRLEALGRRFQKRIERFRPLDKIAHQALTLENFEALWREVYREIVFNKSVDRFSIKDRAIDFILRRKLYPILAPTPIAVIRDWFVYALNEMPMIYAKLDGVKDALSRVPVLIQHAERDETLPIDMARELHKWLPNSNMIEYGSPFTHLSPAFRRKEAQKIVGDYMNFLRGQVLR